MRAQYAFQQFLSQIRFHQWPKRIQVEGQGENSFTTYLAALLRLSGTRRAFFEGKYVHSHIIRNGYGGNRFLGNLVIEMYGKCGILRDAIVTFDLFEQRNVFTWTMMIVASIQCGNLDIAKKVFDTMPQRNVVAWNVLIDAYAHRGQGMTAFKLFQDMKLEGIVPDKVTFLSLLGSSLSLVEGRNLHKEIKDIGLDGDVVMGSALIHMYCLCKSLEDAELAFNTMPEKTVVSFNAMIAGYANCNNIEQAWALFCKMPERNTISWNTIIAAYVRLGHYNKSFELFLDMHLQKALPDKVTFLCLLDACTTLEALARGKLLHCYIITHRFNHDLVISNAIISMYGKCRGLDGAKDTFDEMPLHDIVSWNSIIAAFSKHGDLEGARRIFDKIPEPNIVSWNEMIVVYTQYGNLEDAETIFQKMPSKDVVSWNAMIKACTLHGFGAKAFQLFEGMQVENVAPDKITFTCMLELCAKQKALDEGRKLHKRIMDNKIESDVVVATLLITMYIECGKLDDAKSAFDKMQHRDVVTYDVMITAYMQHGCGEQAINLFEKMQLEGVQPDKIALVNILNACASQAALVEGKQLHHHIVCRGFDSDVVVGTALVNMYGKCGSLNDAQKAFAKISCRDVVSWNAMIAAFSQCGNVEDAQRVFDEMPQRDMVSWTSIITAYGQCGKVVSARDIFERMPCRDVVSWSAMISAAVNYGWHKEALNLFKRMQVEGITPNRFTFVSVLEACAAELALSRGKQIHADIICKSLDLDSVVCTALVIMYGKCGCLQDAFGTFGKMPDHNVISWNVMLATYAQHGCGNIISKSIHLMKLEGVIPDDVTFTSILSAYSHAGMLDGGSHTFVSISDQNGMKLTSMHYICMVDLLGRAGWLDDTEDLISNMLLQPSAASWWTFLGACKKFSDVERGNRAAMCLSEYDFKTVATVVSTGWDHRIT